MSADTSEPADTPVDTSVDRPTVLWDGDCGFCRLWVERWQLQTGDSVDFRTFQEAGADVAPGLSEAELEAAMHLVLPDGSVMRGADAVFATLAKSGHLRHRLLHELQQRLPPFSAVTRAAYGRIAASRDVAYKVTKLLWGEPAKGGDSLARDLFLRLLGIVAFVASWSLAVQVEALYGTRGILPYTEYLQWVEQVAAGDWVARLVRAPTLLWWLPEDTGLLWCAYGAMCLSAALVVGLVPRLTIPGIWLCYLSIMGVGRVFLSFQWDALLLEALVVGWFLAPWVLVARPRPLRDDWVGHAVGRFLVFKLMWLSGWVKLTSNDDAWSSLTALEYHFWTQPLPSWTAYWADRLPTALLSLATFLMFVIELAVPFAVSAPRRVRHVAAWTLIALQLGIAATGNYGFFNVLSIALVVLLFDDGAFERVSRRLGAFGSGVTRSDVPLARQWGAVFLAAALLCASAVGFVGRVRPAALEVVPENVRLALRTSRSFNGYGLFAVMTRDRREIGIELSRDGVEWEPVAFSYKPNAVDDRPRFIGPHMPRLDWQMWFAGLGECTQNVWLIFTARELVEQNPDVMALFDRVPRGSGYRYARFPSHQYRFGDDDWWTREPAGAYCAPIDFSGGDIRPMEPMR
jgi:predicted DCC family thiol-disulfide oxidoreductase YuxK